MTAVNKFFLVAELVNHRGQRKAVETCARRWFLFAEMASAEVFFKRIRSLRHESEPCTQDMRTQETISGGQWELDIQN